MGEMVENTGFTRGGGQPYKRIFKKYFRKSKKSFSLIEALFALVVVGLVIGASAPLVTKNLQSQAMSDAQVKRLIKKIEELENKVEPDGLVRLFYDRDCPTGWSQITTNDSKSLDGYYIRLATNINDIGKTLEPSLPNIIGGFPGVGQFYAGDAKYTPKTYWDLDKNELASADGKRKPNDGLFGAVYRLNTKNKPEQGIIVYNWIEGRGSAARDDYFGFNANYYNPIYGALDNSSTTGVDESANEVRPKSVMFVACKKD